jgi:DICT domain-containing protein
MFDQAFEIAQVVGFEDLGCVANISRRDFDERRTFAFCAEVPVLEYVSLLIENKLLLANNRNGRVYAGFEKLSRMIPVAERYLRIADLSERVFLFGEPDWTPPRHPNLRTIVLESKNRLACECFVIADSPDLRVALVATVATMEDNSDSPLSEPRRFRAIKTSDPAIVIQLAAYAEGLVDDSMAA